MVHRTSLSLYGVHVDAVSWADGVMNRIFWMQLDN